MIVISGITGNTGRIAAETLIAQGEDVLGLTRQPGVSLAGGRVAQVDLTDRAALTEVLAGASAFYVLLPPQWGAPNVFEALAPVIDSVVGAIRDADVPRIVVLSSIAAQLPDGTGPIRSVRPLEAALAGRPGVTFLRPSYFVENLGSLVGAVREGVLPTYWNPGTTLSVVSVADIGRVAAKLLRDGGPPIVQLAGPNDVSFAEVAATFGALLGREVAPLALPPHAITPTLAEMGAGHLATLYAEMNAAVDAGKLVFDDAYPVERGVEPLKTSLARLLGLA